MNPYPFGMVFETILSAYSNILPNRKKALGDHLKLQLQVYFTLMATHSSTNYLLFPLEGMDLSMLYQVLPTVLFRCNGMLLISVRFELYPSRSPACVLSTYTKRLYTQIVIGTSHVHLRSNLLVTCKPVVF